MMAKIGISRYAEKFYGGNTAGVILPVNVDEFDCEVYEIDPYKVQYFTTSSLKY